MQHFCSNTEIVGYHDLDGKPAFKMAMQVVAGRWYLYLTHFWEAGVTVLDVTDPTNPNKVGHIPGPTNTWQLQVQVADGKMITSLESKPPAWGGKPDQPHQEGILIHDVSDPSNPRLLSHWQTGRNGTHRNHYEGGRYVHLTAGMPGFSGNIYVILDIAEPTRPTEVGRWFLPEQYTAGGGKPVRSPLSMHGPAYIEGNRAYVSYGAGGMVILDIADVRLPKLVSRLDFGSAFASWLGIHSVIPLKERNLAVVNTESIEEDCNEPLNFAGIVDIADETKPRLISLLPTPAPAPAAPYRNFSKRGGRFGPHNQHHFQNQPHLLNRPDLVFLTYFNAGLRVYDISDPYLPKEAGYFVPPDPTERRGLLPKTLVAQSEDVLVDARGNAYVTDKNLGVYVVRYTGL